MADVNVGPKYNPLTSPDIIFIVAWLKDSDHLNKPIRMLYIDQFSVNTQMEPDFDIDFAASNRVIRSKIKCWLVAGRLQGGEHPHNILYSELSDIDELVEYVIK